MSLLGIINHLTHVEWRWIDGGMLGKPTSRSDVEFTPNAELTVATAVDRYRVRAVTTDEAVRAMPSLGEPCLIEEGVPISNGSCCT